MTQFRRAQMTPCLFWEPVSACGFTNILQIDERSFQSCHRLCKTGEYLGKLKPVEVADSLVTWI